MEREQIKLESSTTCDCCQKTIEAGDPVFPIYDTDGRNSESHNIPIGEIRSTWILNFCSECIKSITSEDRV